MANACKKAAASHRIGYEPKSAEASLNQQTMKAPEVLTLTPSQLHWPRQLNERLTTAAPAQLWLIGNPEILNQRKIGLFCSARFPESAAVNVYNAARTFCEEEATVVSGFHSPIEKECFRILLEGKQPIIICLARALAKIQLPSEWQSAIDGGRLLLLSRFEKSRRADKETARRRNELVAALSDEIVIIHAEPGGAVERISQLIDRWNLPRRQFA
jgi:predicted Rossmann fold nucleotide-binding protein DprA/Smf involved in DNA uptake